MRTKTARPFPDIPKGFDEGLQSYLRLLYEFLEGVIKALHFDLWTFQSVIVMWSGDLSEIPSGWFLCDGDNGTPDLSDKFILGTTVNGDIGDTGTLDSGSGLGYYKLAFIQRA